ncbi:MAG: hypothetical protein NTX72_05420 [Candidatus Uhrbacteria bacterium]|nr:hypothetical protein [Candidatus Uhrbacteria bacterium]
MQERSKRIFLIIGFIGSVIVIGLAMYVVFFSATPSPTTPGAEVPSGEQPSGTLPSSQAGTLGAGGVTVPTGTGALPTAAPIASGGITQVTALTTGPVSNPTLSADGKSMNFYNKEDGFFYTIDKDGNIVKLSTQSFPNVQSAEWNRNAEKAVLTFPDNSKIVYNFETQTQVTLPKHWEDVNFSPTSDSLIAKSMALDPNNRWLVTSNDNGSNVTAIQALGDNADKVQVSWSPNDQVVGFADTSSVVGNNSTSGFDTKVIYPIGKNQENFKGLVVEGFGFAPSWSPSGKTILYSVYSDYSQGKPLLWLADGTSSSMGDHRHSLSINTWVDKCTWSSDTVVYCAVPQNLPDNAGLQRSLYDNLPDTLYKLDLTNNRTSVVAIPPTDTTMSNLSVSKDGSSLYYTDTLSGQLKLIKLK